MEIPSDDIPTPAGMFTRTSEDDRVKGMPEAGELARAGRLDEVVAALYERASKNMESGRYVVCYAASISGWDREDWQKTDDFDLASEMVPDVATFLLSLRCVRTAKVWFEDRFEDDGSLRVLPICYGVVSLNAREEEVPANKWAQLPLTRTEEADLKSGKRKARSESVSVCAELPPLSSNAPPTGLQAVLAGGIDPASVPLDTVMATAAKSLQASLFRQDTASESSPAPPVDAE